MNRLRLLQSFHLWFVIISLALMLVAGCGSYGATTVTVGEDPTLPIFTSLEEKLAHTSSPELTLQLFDEAVAFEPALDQPGTVVHMGFWSGPGNHGSLVRVIDSINDTTTASGQAMQKAVWDEGVTSSLHYPSYDLMTEQHWYDRSKGSGGTVTIYGDAYQDPNPISFDQADEVWGEYSQRYTDMARLFKQATGNIVEAWCFVQGAKANRIFYKYELPELAALERDGIVRVHFAITQNADWKNPADWTDGTANAPAPVPAS